jgi:hypothetical protein
VVEDSQYFKTVNASFPKIGDKIKLFWGHPEFVVLMHELLTDSGDRVRMGFPAPVLFALHELATDHDHIYPHLARKDASIWHDRRV